MPASPGIRRRSAVTASSRRCRCCGSIRGWRAACCGGSRIIRRRRPTRMPMPSQARSCMRCAAARWRHWVRCRLRNIMAVSTRHRCSCCWPAFMSSGPETTRRCGSCGPRSRPACAGSTYRAIAMMTDLSNISARRKKASPIRAGRIPSMRSSTPTAGSPKAISRWPRCRVMCSPPSGLRRAARCGWARPIWRRSWRRRRARSRSVLDRFWCDDLGTYALALDGDKRPCKERSSNAGQLLFSGMIREDRARKVAADLMRPHFFTGWGIRTIAHGEVRYNPMSYHDGSIWPHDNALIALGLVRYGLKHAVEQVFRGLFDAASYMDLRRLPELFCGFRREKSRGPTLYPVACAPQAWASATPFTLLEAALGLEFDIPRSEIRLRNPRLPAFLDEVILRDLHLGPSSVDLRIRRHGEDVAMEVMRRRGQIQVSIVLAQ